MPTPFPLLIVDNVLKCSVIHTLSDIEQVVLSVRGDDGNLTLLLNLFGGLDVLLLTPRVRLGEVTLDDLLYLIVAVHVVEVRFAGSRDDSKRTRIFGVGVANVLVCRKS